MLQHLFDIFYTTLSLRIYEAIFLFLLIRFGFVDAIRYFKKNRREGR